jgi:8-amino-7-oxononanoate synthase
VTLYTLERRVRKRLDVLDEAGERRRLNPPSGIDFSSNDYLGLAAHPLINKRMLEAVLREGCGSTGSRLLRGERPCFAALERRFAAFKGTEAALYFGGGYLGNLGVLTSFLEPGDVVFSDELNHASIIDGLRLSRARRILFPHRDTNALKRLITAEKGQGQKFLVTESLFSMDGDEAPLLEYAEVCREANTALIVDEAHAVGVYGANGSGLIEEMGIDRDVFLSINPAGKALGACGAFVAGPSWAMDYLIQRARTFIFSTAPPPAIADAIGAALELAVSEPQRRQTLFDLSAYMRSALIQHGIYPHPGRSQIIPVIVGENSRAIAVAGAMREEGFDIRAIRPPTVPEGTARLRISINTNLDPLVLSRCAEILADTLKIYANDSAALSRPMLLEH